MTGLERRKHPRLSCGDGNLKAAFRLHDGSIGRFDVVARNVSRGGIAFMHSKAVEPGADCDLILPTRHGELIGIRGTVRACRNVGIILKEIGVQFDEPLDDDSVAELAIVDR